jgi:Tfp pilus assembly protein PilO
MERSELKNLVLVGLLILAVAYVAWSGFGPIGWGGIASWRADADKLLAERKKLETSVQSAQVMVANLDKIRKEREALDVQLKELSKRLPGERESAEVLRSVESLAGRAGLTLSGVKKRPVRTQELYVELPMDVGVGGGYHELVRFADQLSQLDRLVTLSEIAVSRPQSNPGQPVNPAAVAGGTIRAQMTAVVFQALPEPVAPVAPPGAPGAPRPPAAAPKR